MKGKKNVLYVGGFELPDKNAAAQRVINNSKLLIELNYNVFFNGISKSIDKNDVHFQSIIIDDFHFFSKPIKYPTTIINWINYISSISSLKKIIENNLRNNVSFIIAYNYPAIKLWKLIQYCKKKKIKVIADVTEWYQPEGPVYLKMIKSFDSWLRMKHVHFKLDGIIAISDYLMDYYKKIPCIKLPPLVDNNAVKWKNKKIKKNSPKKVITYVGSPGAGRKDRLDLIIKSLYEINNRFPDYLLQIIGITESEYKVSFNKQPIPINHKGNIIFYGRNSHLEALDLLKSSDFSIFLRDNNLVNTAGFPTKFVESITAGIPVLTNLTSDLKKYLIDGETGFILDVSTIEKLNKSLLKALLVDNNQLQRMKKHCLSLSTFHYQSYRNLFNQFLNNM